MMPLRRDVSDTVMELRAMSGPRGDWTNDRILGLWHNLAYEVHGDRLTVAVAIMESDQGRGHSRPRGKAPRISITLCPKKIREWRHRQGPSSSVAVHRPPSAVAPSSAPSASSAASPLVPRIEPPIDPAIDPMIERTLGLRVPLGTKMFLFEIR